MNYQTVRLTFEKTVRPNDNTQKKITNVRPLSNLSVRNVHGINHKALASSILFATITTTAKKKTRHCRIVFAFEERLD